MNEERISKLIDHLKKIDEKWFQMEHWLIPITAVGDSESYLFAINSLEELEKAKKSVEEKDWCGTAGCIAGHTCMLFPQEGRDKGASYHHIPNTAARILDLTNEEQNYLFTPRIVELSDVTLAQAIVVLEHFLKTGEVDWTLNAGD